ncbi:subtilase [Westerdykella ornata]|uniref:Subtilase n=1 Tax=Westerdykella ornata TaxID=318751 RepID=A0A6A6J9N1_WESOR|nr:subtilase [Westerdykella ornata]KAF2272336.1 subtilase [Westerdykella ornata]
MRTSVLFLLSFAIGAYSAAPIISSSSTRAVPNNFIVVLKPSVSKSRLISHLEFADDVLSARGAVRNSTYEFPGFRGYYLQAPSDVVAYIEADQTVTVTTASKSHTHLSRRVQTNSPWNLARISHRVRGSADYVYEPTAGTYVYILDTGVKVTHQEFQRRASFGFNAVGGSNDDINGHGTHLAGIVSSQTYGIVRFASIIAVKAVGDTGSGTVSQVISAINWAVQDMQTKGRVGKATALLAVGGGFSTAMNNAVANASNAGLMFAVAAGGAATTDNSSPASEPTACTAGGTTSADARMSSSNYGPTIDIWAPGDSITSLWATSDTATNILSGNSVAAAHIAGLGAYFLALEGPRTAVALCERLKEAATPNVLSGIPGGTVNLLAYNLSGL